MEQHSKKIEDEVCEAPKGFGYRHVQVILLFFCLTIAYAERVNMSVAIVAMTDRNSTNPDFPELDWGEKEKSLVLSSFFWGYVLTQIPGGQLAKKFGGKIMLLVSITLCSLLNLLTPTFADFGKWEAVAALRVVQGLCQGVIFPSTHTLLAQWAPPSERGTIGTYCYCGAQFGTVVMLAVSGFLASSSMGWPSIFYFSGVAGLVWSILYFFYGSSSPNDCPPGRISSEERYFIETSLNTSDHGEHEPIKTPWKSILTSPAVIALTIAHSAHNWGFWTILTEIPSYMKSVLHFNIKENALLSAMPYTAMLLMSLLLSPFADWLNNKRILKVEFSRKLFNTIGLWGPMTALICLAYVTDKVIAVALVTIAVGINASTYLGFQINHLDLAPRHSGILMGITNCSANIMSIIAPLLVGFVLNDPSDPTQWRIIFFISAGVYFFGNLQFIIFGRANIQPWNDLDAERKRNDGVENPAMES